MGGEVVASPLVSSFIQVIIENIASPTVLHFIRSQKLDNELINGMVKALHVIYAVLNDAEKKQHNDPQVKQWLDDLRDALYEADDILDEIATKTRRKNEVQNSIFNSFMNLYDRDREMGVKAKEIAGRIENLVKRKDALGLKGVIGEKLSRKPSSAVLVEECDVLGREKDKEAISNLLKLEGDRGDNVVVIPIVGMGGIGKTTLTQLIYNDEEVKKLFDLQRWVSVEEEIDVAKVTGKILEAITSYAEFYLENLDVLQNKLKGYLENRKFLLIFDDFRNDDHGDWEILTRPFLTGAKGSKIIVTTRSDTVVSTVRSIQPYHLDQLSDDDCWLLFCKHAFGCIDPNIDPIFVKIGKEIVKKCEGSPLAAKVLGGLLGSKPVVKDWDFILNSNVWNLPNNKSKMIPALRLSYHYLSANAKQCFAYCSLFPKNYKFEKEKIILLWMAENFLELPRGSKRLEEVGEDCFHDLLSRSFFQRSNIGCSTFFMHNLVHDLVKSVAGEFFVMVEMKERHGIVKRTRHLSCDTKLFDIAKDFEVFEEAKCARTVLTVSNFVHRQLCDYTVLHFLLQFKNLRVLSLSGCHGFFTLHESVGQLIHLRYMNLSSTEIVVLPESMCTLYNLQTLILSCCEKLKMLPKNLHQLVNLRHLHMEQTSIRKMPTHVSKLRNLQSLSSFILSREKGPGIEELGPLKDLRGSLSIQKLEYVTNAEVASAAMLKGKHLEVLELIWSRCSAHDLQGEMDILDNLQPHSNLRDLTIRCYGGTKFPDWLGNRVYDNLVSLKLFGCINCCLLPSLGQLPSLERFHLQGFDRLEILGPWIYKVPNDSSFNRPFPSLKELSFYKMSALQKWIPFEAEGPAWAFPCLQRLVLHNCPKLVGDVPTHLPTLKHIDIKECPELISSIDSFHNLRELYINESEKQVSFLKGPLEHLDIIDINKCPNFESFPVEGLCATNLTCLHLSSCKKLQSLPNQMRILLPSLEHLKMEGCPEIESFPEGGLPLGMMLLTIKDCNKLDLNSMDWHLPRLKCLGLSGFEYERIRSLLEMGLLPISLTELFLDRIFSLETCNVMVLQHLMFLGSLHIGRCPSLGSVTELGRLPASLRELCFFDCPLLGEWYHNKKSEVWTKIAHVPRVCIDRNWVFLSSLEHSALFNGRNPFRDEYSN